MESDDCEHSNFVLPSEVLSHLFSFLPLSDRRKVRLTCWSWYNACNVLDFLQSEKLCIRYPLLDSVPFHVITDTLMKCPYKCLNLEFHGMVFDGLSSHLWERCGPRVLSLTFRSCFIHKESLVKILLYCENLKYLAIDEGEYIFKELEDFLATCTPSRSTKSSLISLKLKSSPVTDYTFSKFIDHHPNIKRLSFTALKLNCYKRIDKRFYPELNSTGSMCLVSKDIFTMSCIFQHIRNRESFIEKLSFNEIGDKGLTDDWFRAIGSLPNLRLKKLTLKGHYILSEDSFLHFFSNQIYLMQVTISDCKNFTLKCALHLLRKCSNLKNLTFEMKDFEKFTFNQELFNTIRASCLLTFELSYPDWHHSDFNRIQSCSKCTNVGLRGWSSSGPVQDLFVQAIVKTYPNLTYLEVIDIGWQRLTDVGLQAIFHRLVILTDLKIQTSAEVTDYGFTGQRQNEPFPLDNQYSIKRLTKMENLSLVFCKCSITELTFLEFVFPAMRRLSIVFKNEISETSFLSMSEHIPLLEYFSVSATNISQSTLGKCLETWRNLQTIRINGLSAVESIANNEEFVVDFPVNCNKSLRFLKVEGPSVTLFYFYDIFGKKWCKRVFKTTGNEKEYFFLDNSSNKKFKNLRKKKIHMICENNHPL